MSTKSDNTLRDWIALSFATGVGSRTAAMLIDRFGSAQDCFNASQIELESAGLKRESIDSLRDRELLDRAERQLEELEQMGGQVITITDLRYPALLRETYDPPVLFYSLGNLDAALAQPAVAAVGSRRCSTYGRNVSEMLARDLATRGVTIVSGLARGIDTAAHRGALAGKGLTIAVMGTGLDDLYPKENRRLADQIKENGALITEFPLATPPVSQNFPFRNRVISGISLGVLIVEGAERSGSLITARMAYEQGREVFAVPGNITSSKSFGPNYLIKDGAKLVQTWRDIVEEFPMELKASILETERGDSRQAQPGFDEVQLSDVERKLLKLLKTDEPTHIDRLITIVGVTSPELMNALLTLEMSDRIRQLPGKNFVRKL